MLVNDGGVDGTVDVCRRLMRMSPVPITLVEHARNFGEHNAVLTGWRHARGTHIVNLDDDGQNPPREALRLWRHALENGLDVVYGHYQVKQHSAWRNAGSWLTNRMTDWALDKPSGLYLSSFRCVSGFVAQSGDRVRRSVSICRRPPAPGHPAHRVHRRRTRTAPRGHKRLHVSPPRPPLAERLAELLAVTPSPRDVRGPDHRVRRPHRVPRRSLALVRESRSELRLRLADGGLPALLRHATRDAGPHRRVPRDGCSSRSIRDRRL